MDDGGPHTMMMLHHGENERRRRRGGRSLRRVAIPLLTCLCLLLCCVTIAAEATIRGANERNDISNEEDSIITDECNCAPHHRQCPDDDFYNHNRANNTDTPSKSIPSGARIFYLITVHNRRTMEDAAYLFRAIRSPLNIILIHVDNKLDWDVYVNSTLYQEATYCPCGSLVHADSVHSAEWGSWSMNLPTLWSMDLATNRYQGQWDVWINLSGDALPVLKADALAQLFHPRTGPLRHTNFVTSSSCETGLLPTNVYLFPEFWHKRRHYTTHPSGDPVVTYVEDDGITQHTITLTTYFGSQWMVLQPDFVQYIVKSLRRPDSLPSRYQQALVQLERLMTDETFFATLLMHVPPFNETLPRVNADGALEALPSMYAIRYERMDEHVPSAFGHLPYQQRYEVPETSLADQPKVWGPYFLGVYDLHDIRRSGALFVRKVSLQIDPNMMRLLPVAQRQDLPDIQWPKEVQVSELPNWKQKLTEMKQAMQKEKDQGQEEF